MTDRCPIEPEDDDLWHDDDWLEQSYEFDDAWEDTNVEDSDGY